MLAIAPRFGTEFTMPLSGRLELSPLQKLTAARESVQKSWLGPCPRKGGAPPVNPTGQIIVSGYVTLCCASLPDNQLGFSQAFFFYLNLMISKFLDSGSEVC
jgi:hypothetical protein